MKQKMIWTVVALMMAAAGMAQKQLTILHTNDTHSTILPLSTLLDDTIKAGRAGFLRRIALINQEREKNPRLLLFDSGDFSQGSAFYSRFKGEVEVMLMNEMGYDAVAIGNHELDYGVENLARILRMAKFPVVCANYDFGSSPLAGVVKPYVILDREGVRVGVFGLSPVLEGLVAQGNYDGIHYQDPIESTRKVVDILRNQEHCDVVICVSHLGWNIREDLDDSELIPATHGIDLVLGGHSHTYMDELEWKDNEEGKAVPVDQNGKHGIFVGKIVLQLEKDKE